MTVSNAHDFEAFFSSKKHFAMENCNLGGYETRLKSHLEHKSSSDNIIFLVQCCEHFYLDSLASILRQLRNGLCVICYGASHFPFRSCSEARWQMRTIPVVDSANRFECSIIVYHS